MRDVLGWDGCTLAGYLDHVSYSHRLVVMGVLLHKFPKAWVGVVLKMRHGCLPTANAVLEFCLHEYFDFNFKYIYIDNTTGLLRLNHHSELLYMRVSSIS